MIPSATHLHAMLVHFPVALLVIAFLAELAGLILKRDFFKNTALFLLILGSAGAIASYFTGNAAGDGLEEGTLGQIMELHEQAALFTVISSLLAVIFILATRFFKKNQNWVKIISFLLFTFVMVSVGRTGYLGGQMVYKHGAGIELGTDNFNNPEINTGTKDSDSD